MIGIDLLQIERMEKHVHHQSMLNKILSEQEQRRFLEQPSAQKLAVAFSAKEAMAKAMGTGFGPYHIRDFELKYKDNGQPYGTLTVDGTQIAHFTLTISHDAGLVVVAAVKSNLPVIPSPPASIPPRDCHAHKGSMGRCVAVGGSPGMAGSIAMTGMAALRTGAGYAYVLTDASLLDILQIKLTEPIVQAFESQKEIITKAQSVVLGPGLGRSETSAAIVEETLQLTSCPVVIDADALFHLAQNLSLLSDCTQPIILTPHRGELTRLLGSEPTIEKINHFVRKYDILLIEKGNHTKVYSPSTCYENMTSNPGMATAGSGDVLSGILGGLLARGLSPVNAAELSVYLHGLAGDFAAQRFGQESMIATDLIAMIPEAIQAMGGYADERGEHMG